MLPYVLLSLLLATPLFATPDLEEAAAIDAEQTFRETQQAATRLMAKNLESPVKFDFSRDEIERPLKEYCDSMRKFPRIQKECKLLEKSITASFDKHEEALKKNGKPDRFREAMKQIGSFHSRHNNLRGIQEDGNNLDPDVLHRERTKLITEMRAYCPKSPNPDMAKSCISSAKQFDNSLADHEENIRNGSFNDPPPSKKIYRNTTPVLRCFSHLPKIRASSIEYKISDPSGRYRFEHFTKTNLGYAINIELSELTKRNVNDPKTIQKTYSDPRNKKTYTFTLSTQFACAPGHSPEMNCQANAISIHLEHEEGSEIKGQARAGIPIKLDSPFDLSLPLDEDEIEEFSLSCAIASKIRKGGWVFSDEAFEEK